MAQDTHLEII